MVIYLGFESPLGHQHLSHKVIDFVAFLFVFETDIKKPSLAHIEQKRVLCGILGCLVCHQMCHLMPTLSILLAFITLQGLSSRRTINYKALRLPAVLTLRLNIVPSAVRVQCNSYKRFFATD